MKSINPQFNQYYQPTPPTQSRPPINPKLTSDFTCGKPMINTSSTAKPKTSTPVKSILASQMQTPESLKKLNPQMTTPQRNCHDSHQQPKCNHTLPPPPNPIMVGGQSDFNWDTNASIFADCCAVLTNEKQSVRVGDYGLSGFDATPQHADVYANRMDEVMHFQKVYTNPPAYIDDSTDLIQGELSNQREINQLLTRPYKGFFAGPGQPSLDNKDLETALQQGLLTNPRDKSCRVTRGSTLYRYQSLPDFGNPQKIEHIEQGPPSVGGIGRAGLSTRDLVRRQDFQRRCQNQKNGQYVNKVPACENAKKN